MTTYFTQFRVTGRGHFPVDMLRYDHCFPATQEAVNGIDVTRYQRETTEVREVELAQYHNGAMPHITFERWRSFGWSVVQVGFNAPRTRKV